MAFSTPQAGDRFVATILYTDAALQSVQRTFEVPFDTSVDATFANAIAHANLLALTSGCKVDELTMTVKSVDAAATAAEAGSTIAHNGIITLNLDVSAGSKSPVGNIQIPYPKQALRAGAEGTKLFMAIDTSATAITNLIAAYATGGDVTLSDGQVSTGLSGSRIGTKRYKIKTT